MNMNLIPGGNTNPLGSGRASDVKISQIKHAAPPLSLLDPV